MLAVPGPSEGQPLAYQDFIDTGALFGVDVVEQPASAVFGSGPLFHPYSIPGQLAQTVSSLFVTGFPPLRGIYAKQPHPARRRIQGIAIDYSEYGQGRAMIAPQRRFGGGDYCGVLAGHGQYDREPDPAKGVCCYA